MQIAFNSSKTGEFSQALSKEHTKYITWITLTYYNFISRLKVKYLQTLVSSKLVRELTCKNHNVINVVRSFPAGMLV